MKIYDAKIGKVRTATKAEEAEITATQEMFAAQQQEADDAPAEEEEKTDGV